jgi:membrane protease YdiL (CAAX protease family)
MCLDVSDPVDIDQVESSPSPRSADMATAVRAATEPRAAVRYAGVGALTAGALPLLALPEFEWLGWSILGALAVVAATRSRRQFGRHLLLLAAAIALLGLVPINTDISYGHMLTMGSVLVAVVAGPYLLSTRVLGERVITFPFRMGRPWSKREIGYVILAGIGSYLLLPFYLAGTGSYLNWRAELDPSHIVRLFLGTNALGIWDEIFFVGVCLALLRRHLPFALANVAQAALWTAFLYELGFRGWGPLVIFPFAMSQGYIFKRSKSLLYIITVHLTIDFMLFLVLVHLHNPGHLRVFVTSPF